MPSISWSSQGGKATFTRPGQPPIVISGADFSASAVTLDGPFRASGAAAFAGAGRASFEMAASAAEGNELPIKAELQFADSGVRAAFDGKLAAEPLGAGWRPKFQGAGILSGALSADRVGGPWPWKATGALTVDPRQASFKTMTLSFGPELRALEATGSVNATFAGEPNFDIDLSAKQLNVDALLRREGEDATPPSRAGAVLVEFGRRIAARDAPPFRAKLAFSSPALFLGASTLENVAIDAQSQPGQPLKVTLESSLPGLGRLRLDGGFDFGAAPEFRGSVEADVGDIGALGEWAARGEPSLVDHAHALSLALPYARMSARGDLQASQVGFSLKNLALELDRTRFNGAAAFAQPQGGERGRVYLNLATDSLDLDEGARRRERRVLDRRFRPDARPVGGQASHRPCRSGRRSRAVRCAWRRRAPRIAFRSTGFRSRTSAARRSKRKAKSPPQAVGRG